MVPVLHDLLQGIGQCWITDDPEHFSCKGVKGDLKKMLSNLGVRFAFWG